MSRSVRGAVHNARELSCAPEMAMEKAEDVVRLQPPAARARARYVKRAAALRRLGYDSYGAYLRAPHWLRLRARYRASDLPQVCVCGETEVQLHHMTYERIGRERLTDLTPLCPRCHALVHELDRRGQVELDLTGLCDDERAAEGRAFLAAMAEEARRRRAQRLADEQALVLSLSYAARLLRAARRAKHDRHINVSQHLFLIRKHAAKGASDDVMTRHLRRLEEVVYGWDGWGDWCGREEAPWPPSSPPGSAPRSDAEASGTRSATR